MTSIDVTHVTIYKYIRFVIHYFKNKKVAEWRNQTEGSGIGLTFLGKAVVFKCLSYWKRRRKPYNLTS